MMTTRQWFSQKVSELLPDTGLLKRLAGFAETPASQAGPGTPAAKRSLKERLDATWSVDGEALSPRQLRAMLAEMEAAADAKISEVEGGRRARELALWYEQAAEAQRLDFFLLLSEQFAPDPALVEQATQRYQRALKDPDDGQAEIALRRALHSPRSRLLQRFAVFPDGLGFLVGLRAQLLKRLRTNKRLLVLDAELEELFSTWFDVAFLSLERISWDSPASLVEKLIRYEAVHDIKGWGDVKNRLDSDRRCYGFFHPQMPLEPLIFVEVALLDDLPASITPLLDETAAKVDLSKATTAIFYSISNTQKGLRGVGFGDSLIKRVVETLKEEFPGLRTFATLSPIPGLRPWLEVQADTLIQKLDNKSRLALQQELGVASLDGTAYVSALESNEALEPDSKAAQFLVRCAACYLNASQADRMPLDAVARFHLSNGARIERLNWGGDPSPKGQKQSFGLMVNYLYDLKKLDKHRSDFAQGRFAVSGAIEKLSF